MLSTTGPRTDEKTTYTRILPNRILAIRHLNPQEYCLSPILFNLHSKYLTKEVLEVFGDVKNRRTSNAHSEICR
jgi:hypothetical protein